MSSGALSRNQEMNQNLKQNDYVINKAFFGKDNCLKVMLNGSGDCYFHFGFMDKTKNAWIWKKIKFNDMELGSIVLVLDGRKKNVSFFHSFKDTKTQIWVSSDKDYVFLKIKEMSKSLSQGEQQVLKVLLEYIILRINMNI